MTTEVNDAEGTASLFLCCANEFGEPEISTGIDWNERDVQSMCNLQFRRVGALLGIFTHAIS